MLSPPATPEHQRLVAKLESIGALTPTDVSPSKLMPPEAANVGATDDGSFCIAGRVPELVPK